MFIDTLVTNAKYLFSNYKGTIDTNTIISNNELTLDGIHRPRDSSWNKDSIKDDAGYASSTITIPKTKQKESNYLIPVILMTLMSIVISVVIVFVKKNKGIA